MLRAERAGAVNTDSTRSQKAVGLLCPRAWSGVLSTTLKCDLNTQLSHAWLLCVKLNVHHACLRR